MRELLIVACGSFFGGGLRYALSKLLALPCVGAFPLGTFAVNVLGCMAIGFVSALPIGHVVTPHTKLFLATGICGGFTTFSTFMSESSALLKAGDSLLAAFYVAGSVMAGMAAVALGNWIGRMWAS